MTKQEIRQKYWSCEWGYDTCIIELKRLGFIEYAADQFLFAE